MKYYILYLLLSLNFIQGINSQNTNVNVKSDFNKALSFHYSNKDSAYYYYEKAIKLAEKQNDLNTLLSSYIYLINANGHYYDLKNYAKNIKKEDSLLQKDKRLDTFAALQYYKDYLIFDKGNYNYKIRQYTTSKKYFKKLLAKINVVPQNKQVASDLAMLSSIYSFLGLNYRHTGKYELAENIFKKNIQLQYDNKDSISNWQHRVYNSKKLLSQVYEVKKDYQKANVLLQETLSFYKTKIKQPAYKNNILSTFMLLAKNYIKQKKFEEAINTLNENTQLYTKDNPFEKEIDILYGEAYLGLKKFKKATTYYNKGLQKIKVYRNNKKHQDVAVVYAKIGKLLLKQDRVDKGIGQYQLALIQLQKEFNAKEIDANPDPEKVVAKIELIRILKEKLEILTNAYTNSKKISYLQAAHKTSKVIIKTLDLLRPEFESKLDKQFLIEETYPSIQKMVEIAYKMYENTNKKSFINDAFFFMEKSKSIFLLEAIRNAEATKYGGIPENIITEEQQFRAKITHIEQTIFKQKKNDKILKEELDFVKNTYYSFLEKVEKEYPKYYALKYKHDVASLENIKTKLQKNQAIFSYLVSEESLYLIVVESNKKAFYKLAYTKDIQANIKNLYRKSSKLNVQDTTIYEDSYKVYKAILEIAMQKTKATDLTIITDGLLNYIPFDALNTSNKNNKYLLETHSISYASSATLLQEQNKVETNKKTRLLIFAPKFSGTSNVINHERTDMTPLLYNEREAQDIAQYFRGKIYKGNKASITNFRKEVRAYNLIHFATHASANDAFPDYSYLAFSKDSTTSNLLYAKDLYNYNIKADLVTLSACETGVGKLQKGEGMLSLARAFNYAGVPAIVTTLWKINDQSTSEVMAYFYENLYNGLNKKEALRQAKLTYLELNDDDVLKHPYYWSGIVLTGNVAQVATTNYIIRIVLVIFFLILLKVFYKKIKANN